MVAMYLRQVFFSFFHRSHLPAVIFFLYCTQVCKKFLLIKFFCKRATDKFFIQLVSIWLCFGLNFHHEKSKGIFEFFILSITRHFYLTPATIFTQNSFQFTYVF